MFRFGLAGKVLLVLAAAGALRAAEPVRLTYWPAANPSEVALAEEIAGEWNAANPGVQVRVQPMPAGSSSEETLLAAIVSGTTPDICSNIFPGIMGRLVHAGSVVPIEELPGAVSYLEERCGKELLDSYRHGDGKLYQVPWKANPLMLGCNTAMLETAGLEPPRTYSEFLDAGSRLTVDTDGDGSTDRWGSALDIKVTWFKRLFDFYPFYLAASRGRPLLSDSRFTMDDAAAEAVLAFFAEGFQRGIFPLAYWYEDPFTQEKVAMKVMGPFHLMDVERLAPPGFRFSLTPLPVPDGHDPRAARLTYGDPKCIVVFSSCQAPEAAWRFVRALTSERADLALVERCRQLPVRHGLREAPLFADLFRDSPRLADFAGQIPNSRSVDSSVHLVQTFDVLSQQFEAASIYGAVPPREAVRAARSRIEEVLRFW